MTTILAAAPLAPETTLGEALALTAELEALLGDRYLSCHRWAAHQVAKATGATVYCWREDGWTRIGLQLPEPLPEPYYGYETITRERAEVYDPTGRGGYELVVSVKIAHPF